MIKKIGMGFLALMIMSGCSGGQQAMVDSKGRTTYSTTAPKQQGYPNRSENDKSSSSTTTQSETESKPLSDEEKAKANEAYKEKLRQEFIESTKPEDHTYTNINVPIDLSDRFPKDRTKVLDIGEGVLMSNRGYDTFRRSNLFQNFLEVAGYGQALDRDRNNPDIKQSVLFDYAAFVGKNATEFESFKWKDENPVTAFPDEYMLLSLWSDIEEVVDDYQEAADLWIDQYLGDPIDVELMDYYFAQAQKALDRCYSFVEDEVIG